MKKLIATLFFMVVMLVPAVSRAEMVNDFYCALRGTHTVEQLYAFQTNWMAYARNHGLDADKYNTHIVFPVYAEVTTTDPLNFVWRGSFKDMVILTKVLDTFYAGGWDKQFADIMNCNKASLWAIPK